MVQSCSISIVWLSVDMVATPSRLSKAMSTLVDSGTTSGRTFRLCGAIGVMMRTLVSGMQMGPPALRE